MLSELLCSRERLCRMAEVVEWPVIKRSCLDSLSRSYCAYQTYTTYTLYAAAFQQHIKTLACAFKQIQTVRLNWKAHRVMNPCSVDLKYLTLHQTSEKNT